MVDTSEAVDGGEKWHPLAALVAGGATVADAAMELSVAERTAYRWASLPEFKSRVSMMRSAVASAAVGRITSATTQAIDTLIELLASEHEAKTRIDAAKLILGNFGPITDAVELRTRVDELESRG